MQMFSIAAASLAVLSFAAAAPRTAFADTKTRISGPHAHENLAVYFIHGPSAEGPVPLTLQEALDKGSVRVLETGSVNELKIENTGDEDIFIQSGDIVKGGRQDRVLRMSFVLPPKSGVVPLAAFCVEAGRWSARGKENVTAFLSASEAMPSREAKLAMRAPMATASCCRSTAGLPHGEAAADPVHLRQQEVWASVAKTQSNLSEQLSSSVASPRSDTSLQLSLENEKLKQARAGYMSALEQSGQKKDDIVGYVFAVNGQRQQRRRLSLQRAVPQDVAEAVGGGVTEAIGAKGDEAGRQAPSVEAVDQFLRRPSRGRPQEKAVGAVSRQEVRDADKALFVEARRSDGAWVHRNYLAK